MSKETVRKTKMHHSFGDNMLGVVCYIIFALCALVCIYPFYYIFINTISANDLSARGVILFWPKGIHFQNYISALRIDGLFQAAKISVLRTIIGTVGTVGASAFLGFMFTQDNMWHRKLWYRLVVATMYFNAGIIPWYLTMRNLHLTNNFWGYIFPAVVSPFYIILTKTFVESVPKELQEAAQIDGAGIMKIFFRVMLPVIKPIMATVAIFSAVNQWNSWFDAYLYTSSQSLKPMQSVLVEILNQYQTGGSVSQQMSNAKSGMTVTPDSIRMAATMVATIPIIMVYPFIQKYFVKGIMLGAVKA